MKHVTTSAFAQGLARAAGAGVVPIAQGADQALLCVAAREQRFIQ